MAFGSVNEAELAATGAGEVRGTSNIVLGFDEFEDKLIAGRFAKLVGGSIDNMDASANPVIAGVVLRNVTGSVEAGSTIDAGLSNSVNVNRAGLVAVDVVTGDAPVAFGTVYAHNGAGANLGKATTANAGNTESTRAEWVEEVKAGVWLIRQY
jgi:hypothetical protein